MKRWGAGLVVGEEVGTQEAGAGEGLLFLPTVDGGMVAGKEDVGDTPAVELGGAGVDGRCQEIVLEGVGEGGSFVGHGAGKETDDGVGHDAGGEFAAGEDVVANGEFAGDEVVAYALIDALVVTAEEDDVGGEGQFVGHVLGETWGVGSRVDDVIVLALGGELADAVENGLYHEDETGVAAEGIVVDFAVLVEGPVPDVVHMYFNEAALAGTFDDGVVEGTLEEFGDNAEYVDTHGHGVIDFSGAKV